MQETGTKNPSAKLSDMGLEVAVAHWNLSPEALTQKTLELGQGELNDTGALSVSTGKFTGVLSWDNSLKAEKEIKGILKESGMDFQDVDFGFFSGMHVFTGDWSPQANQFQGRYIASSTSNAEVKDNSPTFTMKIAEQPKKVPTSK